MSSVDKDIKQLELSYVAGENAKWDHNFGKQLAVRYKVKNALTV